MDSSHRQRMPRARIDELNREINTILAMPDVRSRIEAAGWQIGGGTPESFADFMATSMSAAGTLIRRSTAGHAPAGSGRALSLGALRSYAQIPQFIVIASAAASEDSSAALIWPIDTPTSCAARSEPTVSPRSITSASAR